MKFKLLLALILSVGTLLACGHNEDKSVHKSEDTAIDSANKANSDDTEANTQKDDNQNTDTDSKEDPEANNKMGLSIGDSAVYKDIVGTYKVTLESAEIHDQIKGEDKYNDLFVKMKVKVTNVGDETFNVSDIFDPVLTAGDINDKDKGAPDVADALYTKEALYQNGHNIKPGQSQEGIIAFDTWKSDVYTLDLVNDYEELEGKASWKISKDEMK